MKFRCDRGEMVEKLGIIAGIIPSNTPKPILYDFLIQSEGGSLLVEATDLEVAGRIRIDRVEVMESGKLCLPAAKLFSILREIPDGTSGVTLEGFPERQGANLKADGYEFKLFGNDPEEYPRSAEIQVGGSFEVPIEAFVHSLRRVAIAASHDSTRYQLGGVYFEAKGDKLTLTATDGKRLAHDEVKIEAVAAVAGAAGSAGTGSAKGKTEIEAIVPNRAVDVIIKMLGPISSAWESSASKVTAAAAAGQPAGAAGGHLPSTVAPGTVAASTVGSTLSKSAPPRNPERFTLGFTDTDVVVKTGYSQFNARLIEGSYPNYRNAFPQSPGIKVKMKRSEILAAARSAQLMTDDKTSTVIFRFDDGWMQVWSQAKDVGETRIQIKAEVENGPIEIRFNPSYLVDGLRCIDDEEVRIEFQSSKLPGVLRSGVHYRHLVMPLILETK